MTIWKMGVKGGGGGEGKGVVIGGGESVYHKLKPP